MRDDLCRLDDIAEWIMPKQKLYTVGVWRVGAYYIIEVTRGGGDEDRETVIQEKFTDWTTAAAFIKKWADK